MEKRQLLGPPWHCFILSKTTRYLTFSVRLISLLVIHSDPAMSQMIRFHLFNVESYFIVYVPHFFFFFFLLWAILNSFTVFLCPFIYASGCAGAALLLRRLSLPCMGFSRRGDFSRCRAPAPGPNLFLVGRGPSCSVACGILLDQGS